MEHLSMRYGTITALDQMTLSIPNRVIYGFLGPNGAGKTTVIRLMLGFTRPTAGVARIRGHNCWHDGTRVREGLGYLVPAEALYRDMTGLALLDYMARLTGEPTVLQYQLLDALELGRDALRRKINTYSKGMKQKPALTAATQTAPALLVLDEPSDGLDPLSQRAFEEILGTLRDKETTIFMSSHDLAEVERLCERVAIIREGRIVAEESIVELKGYHCHIVEITFAGEPPPGLDRLPKIDVVRRDGDSVVLSLAGSVTPLRFLEGSKDVVDLLLPPRLEDMFLVYYETIRDGTESTPESSSRGGEDGFSTSPPLDSSTF